MIACTEETHDQAKGIAHFESGLKALDANNMPLAFKDFLAAAKEGHALSQYNVALMYEQGLGISKNEKEAFFWYVKSSSQGNAAAQFNLGVFFENGRGTKVDFAKANAWYRKASVQGDGLAVGNLGMLYIRGQGVKENKVAGVALLLLSAAMDTSPENRAKENISATRGLTADMVTEAQTLSAEMSKATNILVPLDTYLKVSENSKEE
jgi:TPR repeat protein